MIAIMCKKLSAIFDGARCISLPAGSVLFPTDAEVQDVFFVRQGQVFLQRHTHTGSRLVLQRAGPETLLAEASVFSDHYHCEAVAVKSSSIAAVTKRHFLEIIAGNAEIAMTWMQVLARSIQAARLKSEIRSLTKVSERLDAWLDAGHALPEKGQWQDLAAELSVTREALYRELARRKPSMIR